MNKTPGCCLSNQSPAARVFLALSLTQSGRSLRGQAHYSCIKILTSASASVSAVCCHFLLLLSRITALKSLAVSM